MTQQPSDYPVADPNDQPERVETFVDESDDSQAEADKADLMEQHLPPSGDDEEDVALDLMAERSARSDGDRPA